MASSFSRRNIPSSLLESKYVHIRVTLNDAYPSQMLTPSGRFQPNKKICFSMSDFHPGSVRTFRVVVIIGLLVLIVSGIPHGVSLQCACFRSDGHFELLNLNADNRLTGLLSFMLSEEMTAGSVTSTDAHKRVFAAKSHAWNISQPKFKEAFPDVSLADLPSVIVYRACYSSVHLNYGICQTWAKRREAYPTLSSLSPRRRPPFHHNSRLYQRLVQ
jgi:hypothetical protein